MKNRTLLLFCLLLTFPSSALAQVELASSLCGIPTVSGGNVTIQLNDRPCSVGSDLPSPDPNPIAPPACTVGTLPGSAQVTSWGDATYRIPISIPPGSAGIQPNISLVYNSSIRNGQLGPGWAIDGFSRIERCPADFIRDSYKGGINYDSNDRYCLDGKRLVAISGAYGQDGTEYRTDPESYTKIISYGSGAADGPSYFHAYTKSGLILEYGGDGTTSNGAIQAFVIGPDPIRTWALTRVQNRSGSYMNFLYSTGGTFDPSGEYRLSTIEYTGNTCDGCGDNPPDLTVRFTYEEQRSDPAFRYQGGGLIETNKLLTNIHTYLGAGADLTLVKEYRITYEPEATSADHQRISSIEECNAAGNCLTPSSFEWSGENIGFDLGTTVPGATTFIGGHSSSIDPTNGYGYAQGANLDNSRIKFGDFNGDGKTDIFYVNGYGSSAVEHGVFLATGTGFSAQVGSGISTVVRNDLVLGLLDIQRLQLADFNGDGMTDVYRIVGEGPTPLPDLVYLSNGDGTFSPGPLGPSTDVSDNLVFMRSDLARVRFGDFNGDGKADVYHLAKGTFNQAGTVHLFEDTHFNSMTGVNTYDQHIALAQMWDEYYQMTGSYTNFIQALRGHTHVSATATLYSGHLGPFPLRITYSYDTTPQTRSLAPQAAGYSGSHVKFGDFNGDGKTDIYWVRGGSPNSPTQDELWVSKLGEPGSSNFEQIGGLNKSVSEGSLYPVDLGRYFPGDFNGDGLTDIYYVRGTTGTAQTDEIYFSKGDGSFSSVPEVGLSTKVDSSTSPLQGALDLSLIRVADFNGDGRSDIYKISTGTGFTEDSLFLRNPNSGFTSVPGVSTWIGGSANTELQTTLFDASTIRLGDFDGNGMVDIYKVDGWNSFTQDTAYLNLSTPTLLTKVVNGYGHESHFTYKPLTDPSVYQVDTNLSGHDTYTRHFQQPKYVVASTQTSDGVGGLYDKTYLYEGAKFHSGYGFLGFRSITENEPEIQAGVKTHYLQDFPRTGYVDQRSLLRTFPDSQPPGQVFETLAFVSDWSSESLPEGHQKVELQSSSEHLWETSGGGLNSVRTTSRSYQYDSYGNVTSEDVSFAGGDREITTVYSNDPGNWLIGLPTSTTQMSDLEGSQEVTTLKTRIFDLTTGQLTSDTVHLEGGKTRTTTYQYDDFGNLQQTSVTGTDITPRVQSFQYDQDGRFLVLSENGLSHDTNFSYDPRFGTVATEEDPNGLVTTWDYDGFGRLTKVTQPSGATLEQSYCFPSPLPSGLTLPNHFSHVERRSSSVRPNQTVFFDVLGREIRTTTAGFDDTIYRDTEYNSKLQLYRSSQPYYLGDSFEWTTYRYEDAFRRLNEVETPSKLFSIQYEGDPTLEATQFLTLDSNGLRSVSVTNDLSQRTETVYDAQDQIVQVKHFDATDSLLSKMSYQYDPRGNLMKVEDAFNNLTTLQYNLQSLPTNIFDPDRGSSDLEYNVVGDLLFYYDNHNSISMTYDSLGRLKTREAGPSKFPAPTVWTYDLSPNGIGKISTISGGPSGMLEQFEYNSIGKVHKISTSAVVAHSHVYETEFEYDSVGRVSTVTYPDRLEIEPRFKVKQIYNSNEYLAEVRNASTNDLYWRADGRNAANQLTQVSLGNGLQTNYLYDPISRALTNIQTGIGGASTVQDLIYQYGPNLHLDRRENGLTGATEDFLYDDLNRLTQSSVTSGSTVETVTYQYDPLGNLTFKSDVGSYTYGSRPHVATSIAGESYTYDSLGNLTHSPGGRTISYTHFNRPSRIDYVTNYLDISYDSSHRKIHQRTGDGKETVFMHGLYEWANDISLSLEVERNFIYADGPNPIAVLTRSYADGPRTVELDYLHRDRLGSVNVITDDSGTVVDELSFDPFGQKRTPDWLAATTPIVTSSTTRGYTDHQHVDAVGLIDMEGRYYDPRLARFLSADPFTSDPFHSQSWNRYSYVHNRPFDFIDPSGFTPDFPPDPQPNDFFIDDPSGNVYVYLDGHWQKPIQLDTVLVTTTRPTQVDATRVDRLQTLQPIRITPKPRSNGPRVPINPNSGLTEQQIAALNRTPRESIASGSNGSGLSEKFVEAILEYEELLRKSLEQSSDPFLKRRAARELIRRDPTASDDAKFAAIFFSYFFDFADLDFTGNLPPARMNPAPSVGHEVISR